MQVLEKPLNLAAPNELLTSAYARQDMTEPCLLGCRSRHSVQTEPGDGERNGCEQLAYPRRSASILQAPKSVPAAAAAGALARALSHSRRVRVFFILGLPRIFADFQQQERPAQRPPRVSRCRAEGGGRLCDSVLCIVVADVKALQLCLRSHTQQVL